MVGFRDMVINVTSRIGRSAIVYSRFDSLFPVLSYRENFQGDKPKPYYS